MWKVTAHTLYNAQVCDHPYLMPEFEPEEGVAEDAMAISGKLVVLDKLLRHLQAHTHKVLLLSHHSKVCSNCTSNCMYVIRMAGSTFVWLTSV